MAVMSGCFGASGSFPLLWDHVIDTTDHVTVPRIYYLWSVLFACISVPKFLLFTPWKMPKVIPLDYCIFQNTWIRKCRASPEEETQDAGSKQNQLKETLAIFKDVKIYLLFVGYGVFMLRIQSSIAWMSGGWPEWVKELVLQSGVAVPSAL